MKFIHTADWHLGNTMHDIDRTGESEAFLSWLKNEIVVSGAQALVIAGDIFDVVNPSNCAKSQYYRFLASLHGTCCTNVVVVGGNHDSGALLDAPAELLEALNMKVVGSINNRCIDDLVAELKNDAGEVIGLCCAVPFMRDAELENFYKRNTVVGDAIAAGNATIAARNAAEVANGNATTAAGDASTVAAVNAAVAAVNATAAPENSDSKLLEKLYADVYNCAVKRRGERNIPIIATGHLYAADLSGRDTPVATPANATAIADGNATALVAANATATAFATAAPNRTEAALATAFADENATAIADGNAAVLAATNATATAFATAAPNRTEAALATAFADENATALTASPATPAQNSARHDDGVRDVVGTLGNVEADAFPSELDYVALGHIHYATMVAKNPKVRYSGSPFVMGFDEARCKHCVLAVEANPGATPQIEKIIVPRTVRYEQFEGDVATLRQSLRNLEAELLKEPAETYVDILLTSGDFVNLSDALENEEAGKHFMVKRHRIGRNILKDGAARFSDVVESTKQYTKEDYFKMLIASKTEENVDSEKVVGLFDKFISLFNEAVEKAHENG